MTALSPIFLKNSLTLIFATPSSIGLPLGDTSSVKTFSVAIVVDFASFSCLLRGKSVIASKKTPSVFEESGDEVLSFIRKSCVRSFERRSGNCIFIAFNVARSWVSSAFVGSSALAGDGNALNGTGTLVLLAVQVLIVPVSRLSPVWDIRVSEADISACVGFRGVLEWVFVSEVCGATAFGEEDAGEISIMNSLSSLGGISSCAPSLMNTFAFRSRSRPVFDAVSES
ncbi:hypothetical protein MB84_31005 [Pandoraea oxalativorans]|uniref:Uncharacterized protein n=1 Tax=Pandoraea oxalativorans TaxID=573737 RepID=A0A192B1A7_9BURK|nr:hypothetical protein MB84_31005 [Pandoraea oxalativorans]